MTKPSQKIAIVPGSFDPITYGHLSLVDQALKDYDKVYLAVMINPAKEYLFTLEQRKEIAQAALDGTERVEVISSDGMLWQLAQELAATAIIKGYRNDADLAYEQDMALFNAEHNPRAKTVLIRSSEELQTVSSSVVRQRLKEGSALSGFLPDKAIRVIERILSQ